MSDNSRKFIVVSNLSPKCFDIVYLDGRSEPNKKNSFDPKKLYMVTITNMYGTFPGLLIGVEHVNGECKYLIEIPD